MPRLGTVLLSAWLLTGFPMMLVGQRRVRHPEYGASHGFIAIDMRSLSSADTLWMGAIMAYARASEVQFGYAVKDSSGRFQPAGTEVTMVVRYDSGMTVVPHCEIDSSGPSDSVIALAPYAGQDDFMGQVQRAWIVSRARRRFIPFPARRVRCENPFLD